MLTVENIIDHLEKNGCYVAAIVCDNATDMQTCSENIVTKHPGLLALRCAAHSFQLLMNDVAKVYKNVHQNKIVGVSTEGSS